MKAKIYTDGLWRFVFDFEIADKGILFLDLAQNWIDTSDFDGVEIFSSKVFGGQDKEFGIFILSSRTWAVSDILDQVIWIVPSSFEQEKSDENEDNRSTNPTYIMVEKKMIKFIFS